MNWDKVKNIVASVAPTLGTVLGGPLGGAAGLILSQTLGVGDNPEEVYQALSTDPTALAKVRHLEIDKDVEIRRMAEETTRVYVSSQSEVYKAQAEADGQSTRPQIAMMMAWMLCIPYIMIGGAIVYAVTNIPGNLSDLWPVMLAYLSVPLAILRMYFGELRKEQGQRLGIERAGGLLNSILGGK